jgi:hypothetical protein
MRTFLRRVAREVLLALALVALSAGARGQTPPNKPPVAGTKSLAESLPAAARVEYQSGKILFEDGDFATALQKFKSAYAKQADARLLFNIAACEKNLRHYAKASRLFRQYLTDGGHLLTPEDRRDTEELVKAIDGLTTLVKIAVSEAGAQVSLDDEAIGTSPIAGTVVLDIGQRRLRVEKEGFRTITKVVQIDPGTALDLKLERQRGGLALTTMAGATVTLDGKPLGQGPMIKADNLPVGGHTLRIEAPKMRPYQGEVVFEDDKTRTINIDLELDPEQSAEIRVAVGCRSQVPVTPEKGLAVYFDGSSESSSPLGSRSRVAQGEGAAYVPYAASPGTHTVQIRIPTCDPLETKLEATPQEPGLVTGALPPTSPFFNGTPAGSPNKWRVGAGFSYSRLHFDNLQYFFPAKTLRDTTANLKLAGPVVSAGFQWRWLMLLAEGRYVWGSTTGTQAGATNGVLGAVSQAGSFSEWDLAFRFGPRVPLKVASVALGGELAAGEFFVSPEGGRSDSTLLLRVGGWASVDAQPLCDFTVGIGPRLGFFSISASSHTPKTGQDGADVGLFVQAAWVPNTLCDRKRNGEFQLTASGPKKAPGVAP